MELDELFQRLERSAFRQRFRLTEKDLAYLDDKGLRVILDHARDFIARRLAPAMPPNDGKQTPFKGHPVFLAQHATATCCRGCLAKWHRIPAGQALGVVPQAHVLGVIVGWLRREMQRAGNDAT